MASLTQAFAAASGGVIDLARAQQETVELSTSGPDGEHKFQLTSSRAGVAALRDLFAQHAKLKAAFEQVFPEAECWRLLEELRRAAGEACSIEITDANPEFDGPAETLEVASEVWGWESQRYEGESLRECLEKALADLQVVAAAEQAAPTEPDAEPK